MHVSIPYGKGKVFGVVIIDDKGTQYQFPMGKVKTLVVVQFIL